MLVTGRGALAPDGGHMAMEDKQTMPSTSPSSIPQGESQTPQAISPNITGGDRQSPGLKGHMEDTEMDIREYVLLKWTFNN